MKTLKDMGEIAKGEYAFDEDTEHGLQRMYFEGELRQVAREYINFWEQWKKDILDDTSKFRDWERLLRELNIRIKTFKHFFNLEE